MILLIRKRHMVYAGLFLCFFSGLAAILWSGHTPTAAAFSIWDGEAVTVVVDPGHGGEDGGALTADGSVEESGINLEISGRIRDLLTFTGQNTVMTRTEDISIHSAEASSAREKKVSDIHHRADIVNDTEHAVLLSIHQNSLPSSTVTHGAQVFWNTQPGAQELASALQDALNEAVNVGNEKHTRKIPPTIYLMSHITAPGVLVECGFLSNKEETVRLQEPVYQRRLAAAITAGFLNSMAGEEIP